VQALINTPFAEDVLFDRTIDHEVVEPVFILPRGRFPILRRDDLDHAIAFFVEFIKFLNVL